MSKQKKKGLFSKLELGIAAICLIGILFAAIQQNYESGKLSTDALSASITNFSLEALPNTVFQSKNDAGKVMGDFPYLEALPLHRGNARMAQPDSVQLEEMLESGLFTTVVRLNGNGYDSGGLSIQTERKICMKHGVIFRYFNIEERGTLFQAVALLLDGGTLIHCKHGFDRTGAVAGLYLRIRGMDYENVIAHNKWQNYIEQKGEDYRKYLDMIALCTQ